MRKVPLKNFVENVYSLDSQPSNISKSILIWILAIEITVQFEIDSQIKLVILFDKYWQTNITYRMDGFNYSFS